MGGRGRDSKRKKTGEATFRMKIRQGKRRNEDQTNKTERNRRRSWTIKEKRTSWNLKVDDLMKKKPHQKRVKVRNKN